MESAREHSLARPIDRLSGSDLERLNRLLDWHCFVLDGRGRRFGRPAGPEKRSRPQPVPDPRIELLDHHFGLKDKHVLELGCFEGAHTLGLCQRAARVTAVDARIENVVKTVVRCALFGLHPSVVKHDLEAGPVLLEPLADVLFHVGVLYHLRDPLRHLLELGRMARLGLLLDTHFALPEEAHETYGVGALQGRYRWYREAGLADPFSGVCERSRWLVLEDIIAALRAAGFERVERLEERSERNGPRALLLARRG